jgi:NitT/TauT family transport system ATP-binding protein
VLSLEGVSLTYQPGRGDPVHALADVNFHLHDHEFVTVVGPSGCGKSTLLKLIAGLMMPTQGKVIFQDRLVDRPHRDVGLVFQQPVLLKWRNVLGNVLLPVEYLKLPIKKYESRAMELLDLVGLAGFEKKMPHQLSGGMQQRVSLARALIYDPKVLLMDEPFGALDAMTREEMSVELLRICEESRKSVLFVTHSIPEAILLADRVIAMSPRPGRILADIQVDLPRPRKPEMEFSEAYGKCAQAVREVIYRDPVR